jgi:uncharacterized membrane protein YkoI
MLRRKRLLLFTVVALFIAGTAVAIVVATDDKDETPITGDALSKASAAALQFTGGGTVTDSEMGDEEGYYEVEVTLNDGTEVDVHLDQNFRVIGSDADKEDAEEVRN